MPENDTFKNVGRMMRVTRQNPKRIGRLEACTITKTGGTTVQLEVQKTYTGTAVRKGYTDVRVESIHAKYKIEQLLLRKGPDTENVIYVS